MSEEDILRSRTILNRYLYQQKAIDSAEELAQDVQPTTYTGYSDGLGKIESFSLSSSYGKSITNGAIGLGDNIRLRRGGIIPGFDAMPRKKNITQTPSTINKQKRFIVWNTGYTIGGYADLAVDFFSSFADRNSPQWKKCTTDSQDMPDIKGLKLIYIPMIYKSLSSAELIRLKSFQSAGGITFVTGEHGTFSQERKKANEIMSELGSPLRCVDDESSYYNDINNYPATFKNISILYGNAACQITGGKSISVIPESTYTPGRNIVWIAYDFKSRTILSGDVDWASKSEAIGSVNAKFAQTLLRLRW